MAGTCRPDSSLGRGKSRRAKRPERVRPETEAPPPVETQLPSRAARRLLSCGIYGLLGVIPVAYAPQLYAPAWAARTALILSLCPLLLALCLIHRCIEAKEDAVRRVVVLIGLTVIVVLHLLSLAWTPDRPGGILWNCILISLVSWFGLIWCCVPHIVSVRGLVTASVVGAVAAALVGIFQRFGIEVPPFGGTTSAPSTFVNGNVAAQYFAIIVPLTLVMILQARGRWAAIGWTGAFLLATTYLVFTRCRGGWIGASLAMLCACAIVCLDASLRAGLRQRMNRFKAGVVVSVFIAMCLGALLVPIGGAETRRATWNRMWQSLMEPIRRLQADPGELRPDRSLLMWAMLRSSAQALQYNWALGLGADGFRPGIVPYMDQNTVSLAYRPGHEMRYLHCDPVQFLLEAGVLGGLGMTLVVGAVVRSGWRVIKNGRDNDSRWLALGCLAGLVGACVHSLVSFPFHMPTSALLAATLAGALLGLDSYYLPRPSATVFHRRWPLVATTALCAIASVACVCVAFGVVSAMAHVQDAWLAKRLGNGSRALAEINRAMASSDLPLEVRREYGVIHSLYNPDREEAAGAVSKALANDPYYINNLVNMAGLYVELGRTVEAKNCLQRVLCINNETHVAHYMMGVVALREERPETAEIAFSNALRLCPDFQPAKLQLRRLQGNRGRVEPQHGQSGIPKAHR